MKYIFFLVTLTNLQLFGLSQNQEYNKMQEIVTKVHKSINYGVGSNECNFNDEIIKRGE